MLDEQSPEYWYQFPNYVVMIAKGQLHFDGDIEDFKSRFGGGVQLKVTFMQNDVNLQHKHLQIDPKDGRIFFVYSYF